MVGKVVKVPETEGHYYISSWNREIDCYVMEHFHTRKPLIISRDYLMQLLDNRLSKILI